VVLGQHGGDHTSEGAKKQPDNDVSLLKYGNSTLYTLARLDRDHSDLAAQVRAGKMSANAAALQHRFGESARVVEDETRLAHTHRRKP
jgi:hypothetical protein